MPEGPVKMALLRDARRLARSSLHLNATDLKDLNPILKHNLGKSKILTGTYSIERYEKIYSYNVRTQAQFMRCNCFFYTEISLYLRQSIHSSPRHRAILIHLRLPLSSTSPTTGDYLYSAIIHHACQSKTKHEDVD